MNDVQGLNIPRVINAVACSVMAGLRNDQGSRKSEVTPVATGVNRVDVE